MGDGSESPAPARQPAGRQPAGRQPSDAAKQILPAGGTHQYSCPPSVIREVWAWLHSVPPYYGSANDSDMDAYADAVATLNVTDVVLSLNGTSLRDIPGAAARPPPNDPDGTPTIPKEHWPNDVASHAPGTTHRAKVTRLRDRFARNNVRIHFMIYVHTEGHQARDGMRRLRELARDVHPRSVQLDAEGWWRGRMGAGARTIDRELTAWQASSDRWPPLGLGVTGLAAGPRRSLLRIANFGMPQMYASRRNYHTSDADMNRLVRSQYLAWSGAVGRPLAGHPSIVVGHTAQHQYLSGFRGMTQVERMRQALQALYRIGACHPPHYIESVAYWSTHDLRARPRGNARRDYVTRIAGLASRRGLQFNDL